MAVSEKDRIIRDRCKECGADLSLRLPPNQRQGEFSFICAECGSEQSLAVGPKGTKKFKTLAPAREVARIPDAIVEASRKTRLKVIAALLVVSGLLGLVFSIMTVTGSFTIKDIEEQSQGQYTSLTVSVIDSRTGRPIEGARITLSGEPNNITGFTDPAGLSVMAGIPPGTSTIILTKDGYKSVRSEIVLRKGTPNVLDVPMEEGDPSDVIPVRTPQFVTKDYSTLITDVMAMIMFMTSVIAFVAAYFSFRGEFFLLSLVGAFLSIFSIGFLMGSILSLVATVIITFSYDEFTHTHVLRKLLALRRS